MLPVGILLDRSHGIGQVQWTQKPTNGSDIYTKDRWQNPVGQLAQQALGQDQVLWFNMPPAGTILYSTPSGVHGYAAVLNT